MVSVEKILDYTTIRDSKQSKENEEEEEEKREGGRERREGGRGRGNREGGGGDTYLRMSKDGDVKETRRRESTYENCNTGNLISLRNSSTWL